MKPSNSKEEEIFLHESMRLKIPLDKYKEITILKKKANYNKEELRKAIKFLLNINLDDDTCNLNIEIIINKLICVIKQELKAELLKENWRMS